MGRRVMKGLLLLAASLALLFTGCDDLTKELEEAILASNGLQGNLLSIVVGTGGSLVKPDSAEFRVEDETETHIEVSTQAGYTFDSWLQTGGDGTATIVDPSLASTSMTLKDGDATVTANFIPATYTLTLNVSDNADGWIESPGLSTTVSHGVPEFIEASSPQSLGMYFAGWTKTAGPGTVVFDDAASQSTNVTITGGDATITASYETIAAQITSRGSYHIDSTAGALSENRIDDVVDIEVQGNYVFVGGTFESTTDNARIVKLNCSSVTSPTRITTFNFPGESYMGDMDILGFNLTIGTTGSKGDFFQTDSRNGATAEPYQLLGAYSDVRHITRDLAIYSYNGNYTLQNIATISTHISIDEREGINGLHYTNSEDGKYLINIEDGDMDPFSTIYAYDEDDLSLAGSLQFSESLTDLTYKEWDYGGSNGSVYATGYGGVYALTCDDITSGSYEGSPVVERNNLTIGEPVYIRNDNNYLITTGDHTTGNDSITVFDLSENNGSVSSPYRLDTIVTSGTVEAMTFDFPFIYTVEYSSTVGTYMKIYELTDLNRD